MKINIDEWIERHAGGNKFIVMTGSKHFVVHDNALSFQVIRNPSGANRCVITLEPSDTYTVIFQNVSMKTRTVKEVSRYDDAYNDMLQDIFTSVTAQLASVGVQLNQCVLQLGKEFILEQAASGSSLDEDDCDEQFLEWVKLVKL